MGAFDGRPAIESMMRAFFSGYERPRWTVAEHVAVDDRTVEFAFTMTATGHDGTAVERRGLERITFDAEGSIESVLVSVAA